VIIDKIVGFVIDLFVWAISLMPGWIEPWAVDTYSSLIQGFSQHVHNIGWFDIPLLLGLVGLTVAIYAATGLYTVVVWIYNKIPGKAT
jgi:hypothetical protein